MSVPGGEIKKLDAMLAITAGAAEAVALESCALGGKAPTSW
jgi:hypothetical protein